MKKFGIAALAGIAALVLGTAVFGTAPKANADATDVVDVHCVLFTGAPFTDVTFDPCTDQWTSAEVQDIADSLGDLDGTLEPSDLSSGEPIDEAWDGNQLSEACTAPNFCANLIFVFVDDEAAVTLDTPSGLTSVQAGGTETDAVCDTDNDGTTPDGDFDCSDPAASNGDGVVVFNVYNFNAERGDTKEVFVRQEDVEQSVELNIVGSPNDVVLTLVEDTIETNGSVADANDCAQDTPADDAISPPNATLAYAIVYDEDDRELTMVPVTINVDPPGDDPDIATLGQGNPVEGIASDTLLSIVTGIEDAPIAHYVVVCGGSGTGETTIKAQIDDGDADFLADDDTSTQDLTVIGAPASVALSAVPSSIKCDGSETATVTATVTDADGNPLVAGVPVNFSVVALGTANPINTETDADGKATSVITPLSNSSAGVTVIVTAGDSSIKSPVQTSIRVDCALPLETQPTLAPGGGSGPISPPDTGNGGYLGQDGGSSSWLLVALAAALGTVVFAGGLVTRRAGK